MMMGMKMMITFKDFIEQYGLVPNDFESNASIDGCLFETYGAQLEFVKSHDKTHIWTLIQGDSDDGGEVVLPGYHMANRIGYLITREPWTDDSIVVTNY
jgi:hypothetical protein